MLLHGFDELATREKQGEVTTEIEGFMRVCDGEQLMHLD